MTSFRMIPVAVVLGAASLLAACTTAPTMPMGTAPMMAMHSPEQMAKMDGQMKTMHQMHQQMMAAKTPEERNAMMAAHMKTMHDGMETMKGMPGMPGMPAMPADMVMNKPILQIALLSAFAAAAGLSGAAPAQPAASAVASMVVEPTDGEVRKIDKPNRRITLKHGEIRNLGMPPMAMVFEVKDRAMLDKLKEGDKVRFKAVYQSGRYVVTEIRPAR
jgi:Cu(I)/Ag(I) efflux system protein CusF